MVRGEVLGARAIGCIWLIVAGMAALLSLMSLGTWLALWPLALGATGVLAMTRPTRRAMLLSAAAGALGAAFATWVAANSTGGNENTALVIAAVSGLLAVASLAAWAIDRRGA